MAPPSPVNAAALEMCVAAKKNRRKSIKKPIFAFKSSKVIDLGGNREPVYDFLLVINSNLGPISHSYWDTATYWLKIANFAHPSHLAPSLGVILFEFMEKLYGS